MRVGLHTPGDPTQPESGLDPVQIVRLQSFIKPREGVGLGELDEEAWIDQIVQPAVECAPCKNFAKLVGDWGRGVGRQNGMEGEQAEILLRIHSMMGDHSNPNWGKAEGLPANATLRAEAIEDIHTFAYRFARCVDWRQWGNESFGGAAGYKFYQAQIDCEWSGSNPRSFQDLPNDCKSA
jgi:hypothetical protein